MWNPKRIMLLIAGLAVFCTSYGVYAHFLGGIDGLPPLPPDFWPVEAKGGHPDIDLPPPPNSEADLLLAKAFGERSEVLHLTIKVVARARGVVLATDDFKILDDGRVKLEPFRIALFGKARGEFGTPEINTVSSDVAFLTFDERVTSITDMGNHKITASQLEGKVTLVNNRRTLQQDDDLSLFTQGPVFYQADKHYIFTLADVRLTDCQSKPKPMTVNATGMDVYLLADDPNAPASARKAKVESISGVDKVVLRSSVEMHLYVDSRSGFLATEKPAAKPAGAQGPNKPAQAPAAPPSDADKSHLVIRTEGRFVYDVVNQHAQFDVSQRPSFLPKEVNVIREHEQGKLDHLICDHLELQFHPKNPQQGPSPLAEDDRGVDLEIDSAHATAESGKEVILSSDGERLDAFCKDLFYDAKTHTSILKGETAPLYPVPGNPRRMKAVKDLNVIYARELQLVDTPAGQQATARGPGEIDLYDNKTNSYPMRALWTDQLVSAKDGVYDSLTLTGNAAFEDQEHGQNLRADSLKVWLQLAGPGSTPAPADANPQQRIKPHHVEGKGHVTADSAELHITGPTEHLVIWFKDAPVAKETPPDASAAAAKDPAEGKEGSKDGETPARAAAAPSSSPAVPAAVASSLAQAASSTPAAPNSPAPSPASAAVSPAPAKKPMNLVARSIEATVLRTETKNDLDRLWCEGAVRVKQEGATPEDRGVDIQGDTLQLTHFVEGNVLVVTGNLGQVQLNRTTIFGPEVTIDQKTNVVKVNGTGIMKLPSNTDFNGAPLAHPAELTVVWKEAMFFDGKCAEFHRDVQAKQKDSRLLCQEMQVYLDKPMSFKEGEKGAQAAKVEKLLCDKKVFIEEKILQGTELVSYKRLTVPVVALDNTDSRITAPGPGMVHILQMGDPDDTTSKPGGPQRAAPSPAREKGKDKNEVLKLTRVSFRDRLYANNVSRTAIFYGDVRVVHVPTNNPDLKIDLEHPPEGFLYLTCEQLKVFTDSRKNEQLEAQSRVVVQAQEFWGNADVLKYDEEKEQVIFEGTEGNPAVLYRAKKPGAPFEKVTGKKIIYLRRTNDAKIEEGDSINLSSQ